MKLFETETLRNCNSSKRSSSKLILFILGDDRKFTDAGNSTREKKEKKNFQKQRARSIEKTCFHLFSPELQFIGLLETLPYLNTVYRRFVGGYCARILETSALDEKATARKEYLSRPIQRNGDTLYCKISGRSVRERGETDSADHNTIFTHSATNKRLIIPSPAASLLSKSG